MRHLHDAVVRPLATGGTKSAWFAEWRIVSLDGSTLDVADEGGNEAAFGRPGASRGERAFPQIHFVSLARSVLTRLRPGMLCLADRHFFGYDLCRLAADTGADLFWRIRKNPRLECDRRLPDSSYLSRIYPSERDRRHQANAVVVRVIEYRLEGIADAEPIHRLMTTILDPHRAPAERLATLYHERWKSRPRVTH